MTIGDFRTPGEDATCADIAEGISISAQFNNYFRKLITHLVRNIR
jgi:hypothetical protein